MAYLVDTNVFLRLVPKTDPLRKTVLNALRKLKADNEDLYYTTQILAEFWTVCTRPSTTRGGYGLSTEQTERKARLIERHCRLLPDSLATHQTWRQLIVAHSVKGVAIHDARLVATMKVHGIESLLTFDTNDFNRYQGVSVVAPADLK